MWKQSKLVAKNLGAGANTRTLRPGQLDASTRSEMLCCTSLFSNSASPTYWGCVGGWGGAWYWFGGLACGGWRQGRLAL